MPVRARARACVRAGVFACTCMSVCVSVVMCVQQRTLGVTPQLSVVGCTKKACAARGSSAAHRALILALLLHTDEGDDEDLHNIPHSTHTGYAHAPHVGYLTQSSVAETLVHQATYLPTPMTHRH